MSRRSPIPLEVQGFMLAHTEGVSTYELARLVCEAFPDHPITREQARYWRKNRGLCSGVAHGMPAGYSPLFPEGFYEWMAAHVEGRSSAELAQMASEHFGMEITQPQIRAYKKNHKLRSGIDFRYKKGQPSHNKGKHVSPEQRAIMERTMFKPGSVPANTMPVGTVVTNTEGYKLVKVCEEGRQRDKWKFLHRQVWEAANGPVPDGCMIIFRDGDNSNCDLDNLRCVTKAVHLEMVRNGYRFSDPELTEACAKLAELQVTVRTLRKEKHRHD